MHINVYTHTRLSPGAPAVQTDLPQSSSSARGLYGWGIGGGRGRVVSVGDRGTEAGSWEWFPPYNQRPAVPKERAGSSPPAAPKQTQQLCRPSSASSSPSPPGVKAAHLTTAQAYEKDSLGSGRAQVPTQALCVPPSHWGGLGLKRNLNTTACPGTVLPVAQGLSLRPGCPGPEAGLPCSWASKLSCVLATPHPQKDPDRQPAGPASARMSGWPPLPWALPLFLINRKSL